MLFSAGLYDIADDAPHASFFAVFQLFRHPTLHVHMCAPLATPIFSPTSHALLHCDQLCYLVQM